MSDRNDNPVDGSIRSGSGFERRPLLKALGVETALSFGVGTATAADEHGSGNETDDDGHFLEDLVDPTFGYPLAAGETDELDPANIVEQGTVAWEDLTIEGGSGEIESGETGSDQTDSNETG